MVETVLILAWKPSPSPFLLKSALKVGVIFNSSFSFSPQIQGASKSCYLKTKQNNRCPKSIHSSPSFSKTDVHVLVISCLNEQNLLLLAPPFFILLPTNSSKVLPLKIFSFPVAWTIVDPFTAFPLLLKVKLLQDSTTLLLILPLFTLLFYTLLTPFHYSSLLLSLELLVTLHLCLLLSSSPGFSDSHPAFIHIPSQGAIFPQNPSRWWSNEINASF